MVFAFGQNSPNRMEPSRFRGLRDDVVVELKNAIMLAFINRGDWLRPSA